MKLFKVLALTLVCLILGAMIAWQYSSVKKNQVLAQYEKQKVSTLVDELLLERGKNEDLRLRIQELQKEVDAFKDDENNEKNDVEALHNDILAARVIAGLETVKGPGLVISLESQGEIKLKASHVQELLNELKASDAQALSVNDERIVATSEVREAGGYVMINGSQLLPPYTIKVIGDPENIERSLSLIVTKYQAYDFRIEIHEDENVVIPAVRDDGTVLHVDKLTPVGQ